MKKAIVAWADGREVQITAPEGKDMAVDTGLLQHGILQFGETPGGTKIAAFQGWSAVSYEPDGYELEVS